MSNEELTAQVSELRSLVFAVGDLAQTLAAELKATNERHQFAIDGLHGVVYAQEATIHALMAPLLRNGDLNQKLFLSMFDSGTEHRRAGMPLDSLQNFDTIVNNARQLFDALAA